MSAQGFAYATFTGTGTGTDAYTAIPVQSSALDRNRELN